VNRSLPQAILDQLSLSERNRPEFDIWRFFDEKEWERTLAWLDLSGLTLYFRHRLNATSGSGKLPAHVQDRMDQCQADNRLRTLAIAEELKALTELFAGAGIECVVLKGMTMLPDYCPDLALRTQYDHDLLLRPSSLASAETVLREAGYRRRNTQAAHAIEYHRPEAPIRFAEHWTALYSPRLARCIELHVSLWESADEKIDITLPEDLFQRAGYRRRFDFGYTALSEEDALVFQILHAFRHILENWCRLAVFFEIAYFLDQRCSDRPFWDRFGKRIENLRWLPDATALVFGLAEQLFGASPPPAINLQMESHLSPTLTLWTERYGKQAALANFRNGKYTLFLHREFVDDRAAWANIVRRRLFPLRRPHRPPAVAFQRGFSHLGRLSMEGLHALRRLKFHALSDLRYLWEYPRWMFLRKRAVRDPGVRVNVFRRVWP
jgi:hypothetical protein